MPQTSTISLSIVLSGLQIGPPCPVMFDGLQYVNDALFTDPAVHMRAHGCHNRGTFPPARLVQLIEYR